MESPLQDQRALSNVPLALRIAFVLALGIQILFQVWQKPIQAQVTELTHPPSSSSLMLMGFGDPIPVFYGLLLWLQAFDNQPGVSIPYAELEYQHLTGWLDNIISLYPESAYPLLLSSRIYSQVADSGRQRLMLEFIRQKFVQDPNGRWRWMAEATLVAKHKLQDLPLALSYASQLTELATSADVPYWAKDMQLMLLRDMNELEAARVLIGGLLESGEIKDPYEIRFLEMNLKELE